MSGVTLGCKAMVVFPHAQGFLLGNEHLGVWIDKGFINGEGWEAMAKRGTASVEMKEAEQFERDMRHHLKHQWLRLLSLSKLSLGNADNRHCGESRD
jgi:hypothetical protein